MLTKNFGRRTPKICSHHATEITNRFVRRPPRTGPFWAARTGFHHDLTAVDAFPAFGRLSRALRPHFVLSMSHPMKLIRVTPIEID
jgi:hypothetical protein